MKKPWTWRDDSAAVGVFLLWQVAVVGLPALVLLATHLVFGWPRDGSALGGFAVLWLFFNALGMYSRRNAFKADAENRARIEELERS